MVHLRIEFNKKTCIGNKACVAQDPEHFGFDKGFAVLKGSHIDTQDLYVLDKEFSDEQADSIEKAAQVCPVNAITVKEGTKSVVGNQIEKTTDFRKISAKYDDAEEFVLDPKGYFLIKIEQSDKTIHVGFCTSKNKLQWEIIGKKPLDIYQTIIKENIIDRLDHAAYLGRELQKAYTALQQNIRYVQDDELVF